MSTETKGGAPHPQSWWCRQETKGGAPGPSLNLLFGLSLPNAKFWRPGRESELFLFILQLAKANSYCRKDRRYSRRTPCFLVACEVSVFGATHSLCHYSPRFHSTDLKHRSPLHGGFYFRVFKYAAIACCNRCASPVCRAMSIGAPRGRSVYVRSSASAASICCLAALRSSSDCHTRNSLHHAYLCKSDSATTRFTRTEGEAVGALKNRGQPSVTPK